MDSVKRADPVERFLALSEKEKQAEIQRCINDVGRQMTAAEQRDWNKTTAALRAKRGRPKTGAGVQVISLSVEKALLKRADARAKKEGVSRAALVARGLEAILKAS